MPLTKGQIAALAAIASARDPESYIAGSVPLNREQRRYSADIDIFHDREERVALAADVDAATLDAHGFAIRWLRRSPGMHTLVASRDGEAVRLEWVADSDFRFFPTVPDPQFGYVLHPVDLALNKVSAAANRRELRDIVDLIAIEATVAPLGALIWAAVEKSPGFSPESMIEEIRRNAVHPAEEWRSLVATEPIEPQSELAKLRAALSDAERFVKRMPTARSGLLFLSGDQVVQPDPDRLSSYLAHEGKPKGHWPSSPEIAAAMMQQFTRKGP